ncbi:MAG: ABC transporter ATP-binding protein [Bacteroidales bacterium]|nr:ABC transporter ATP-binding protein [Bacteroidales bacterium]NLH23281.1 ABC transporter ATP-binding protein [Bacteroidales bacterium]HPJ82367.1 ABC transporter ATP-binding protein [Bacteroidales bacterium]
MKSFLRILAYGKPYRRYWPSYLALSVLSVLFGIANYALVAPLLTILFQADTLAGEVTRPEFSFSIPYIVDLFRYYMVLIKAQDGILMALVYVSVSLLAASLLANLTHYLSQRILVDMRTNLMKNIREDLFRKISRLQIGYFHDRQKGDLLSSISNDVNEVQNSVAGSFHILFRDPLLIVGFLAMLFYMSPKLTLVTLLTLPVSALLIGRITRSLRSGAEVSQNLLGKLLSHFEEAISGSRIIKAFNAQQYVRDRFNSINDQHRIATRKLYNRQELASPLGEFLGISVAAAVLFYGGWLQVRGDLGMTWPEFVVYIGFYWRVLEPAKSITRTYAMIRKGMVSAGRIFSILDAPVEMKKDPDAIPVHDFMEAIEYRDVSFRYKETDACVLKNINLVIPRGKVIALVGPSGGGKTTLADLLPRFYDVKEGAIMMDGVDIRKYRPRDLIGLMGVVTQEAILFNDTVANNITFGLENIPRAEVENAARIANAHDFIMELEHGYDTNIGDRGVKLSGGQRQRLAIARAVLKNPPILILDEATSALDSESEKMVQEALTKLMKNRTSVVIAHRLSTVRDADQILVIDKGCITEQGTHKQLLAQNGMYKHLCDLQAFG